MAIFRPEIKQGPSKFFGICEVSILKYEDKSDQFDWADIFIDITVQQKGSEYSRNLKIAGALDKDSNGLITGGSVLKRLYNFFDAVGCSAGINVKGGWEDEEGTVIDKIEDYLADRFVAQSTAEYKPVSYDYLAYFYKEQPKVPGGKSYTRAWNKIYKNLTGNKEKLQSDVNFLPGN